MKWHKQAPCIAFRNCRFHIYESWNSQLESNKLWIPCASLMESVWKSKRGLSRLQTNRNQERRKYRRLQAVSYMLIREITWLVSWSAMKKSTIKTCIYGVSIKQTKKQNFMLLHWKVFIMFNKISKQAYLVKWRADCVSYNTDEAITCWTIEDVKWADEHKNKNLKNVFGHQHQSLVWYHIQLRVWWPSKENDFYLCKHSMLVHTD